MVGLRPVAEATLQSVVTEEVGVVDVQQGHEVERLGQVPQSLEGIALVDTAHLLDHSSTGNTLEDIDIRLPDMDKGIGNRMDIVNNQLAGRLAPVVGL
jgi:hypothetical protein